MAYPFKNNPTQKKLSQSKLKKKPPKLKLTHPTQIKSNHSKQIRELAYAQSLWKVMLSKF
jgi:hypothetical protein